MKSAVFNVRLVPDLKSRAEKYASSLGLSLNALVVVALSEYLNEREKRSESESLLSQVTSIEKSTSGQNLERVSEYHALPNGRCSCGSPKLYKNCHGRSRRA
jgi:antitoxin component of RelBE/YafQ-DinJ toxin-antitoxin module